MKKFYPLFGSIILHLFIANPNANAQAGEWVWIHGSQTQNAVANYGTKGVASPTNVPASSYEPCEWTDKQGNFWFYGGLSSNYGNRNDLWKYDPVTNQWTWMTGTQTTNDPGNYGVQGVPSATNRPPARAWGPSSWVDLNGNLWMFGGLNSGTYSDLWRYDIATNIWTWMKGPNTTSQAGVYGIQGVPSPTNVPPSRYECGTTWTDNAGNLWLFGGHYSNGLSDLWKYDITTNEWTWMKGPNTVGALGVYGTLGTPDPANVPGGRDVYAKWKDNSGNFWIFGGGTPSISDPINDLWRYEPATNNWTWMSGSDTTFAPGVYGTRCVTAPTNVPGARFENRTAWTDANGNFWLFGGGVGSSFQQVYNDLWMYCVANGMWTWESGNTTSNPSGSWGTLGVSSPTNKPDGRGGAIGWTDGTHLYLFGGTNSSWSSNYNDLWKYTIDPNCGTCPVTAVPVADFISSDSAFCSEGGSCIDFTDKSTGSPTSWKWSFPGAVPDTSTQQNPINICYYIPGSYSVTLIAGNSKGTDTLTVSAMIIFASGASLPVLTLSHDTIFCSYAVAYQWYFNGSPIPGATDSFYVAADSGNYNVYITDSLGCSRLGNGIAFVSVNEISGKGAIHIYPNPAKNELVVLSSLSIVNPSIEIYNPLGQKVYENKYERQTSGYELKIDISTLTHGIYILNLNDGHKIYRTRFVKE